jgi:predicted metal-binding membrane protein
MTGEATLGWLLRRDRAIVATALVAIVVLAWSYLLFAAGSDTAMGIGGAMTPMPWTLATFGVMVVMWIMMMIAMMLPSAASMILLFATIDRRKAARGSPYRVTGLFALGYLVVWAAFGVAATSAQWGLEQARLLSPAMAAGSSALAGALLLLAGLYQMTPLKQACLRQCRSPLDFLTRYWRAGPSGAFGMGLRHGIFCLGCCWAAMALLFVGGVMNLFWIAALALFVLLEKVVPAGRLLGRAGGIGLILWGGATLLALIAAA